MDVAQIRAFVEIARLGTIQNASQSLCYSQSGVSRQLHALEGHLGVLLFARTGGRLSLTRPGEDILPLAQSIVALSDALLGSAGRTREYAAPGLARVHPR